MMHNGFDYPAEEEVKHEHRKHLKKIADGLSGGVTVSDLVRRTDFTRNEVSKLLKDEETELKAGRKAVVHFEDR